MSVIGLLLGLSTVTATSAAIDLPNVLTLDRAEQIADQHQPAIRQADAIYRAADARTGEAFAGLLPQVSASAIYQRATGNPAIAPGTLPKNVVAMPVSPSFHSYGYLIFSGQVQQLIYDFGQTTGRWHAAEAAAQAQQAAVRATRLIVVYNVRQSFFNARAQKDLVRVAKDTLANQQRHLDQIQGFVDVGTRPDIDLVQAKTDRANAEVQLINAENGYAIAKAQLNQAMGIEGTLEYDVSDETFAMIEGEGLTIDPLVTDAVRARPELAQIDQQLRSQSQTIDSAKGGYYPSIGAQAGLTERGPAIDNLIWNWNLQLIASWNIFQGFLTEQTVKEARANYDALSAQLDTLRLSIRLEVEQAFLAVRAAKSALSASEEALLNAKERLRLAEGRYETGVGNIIELGDAQVALTLASAQSVSASYNLATARALLLKALGRR